MATAGGQVGAAAFGGGERGGTYRRHRPEQTLLYQVVARHYPAFVELMEAEERPLPGFVRREFEAYLKCGRLEHGFLRVRCEACQAEKLVAFSCKRRGWCPSCGARRMADTAALLVDEVLPEVPIRQWVLSVPFPLRFLFAREPAAMGAVLRLVVRAIESWLIGRCGHTRANAQGGAVTLVQRFGSALNMNIHFHMLLLDGVYAADRQGRPRFVSVPSPTPVELTALLERIVARVGHHLERRGLLERAEEQAWLSGEEGEAGPLDGLLGASITYRIAVGPQRGEKAFMLRTLPPADEESVAGDRVARVAGFSLHAGIAARADQRTKVERLCRYIARPAVAEPRLSLTERGEVRYTLKTPYRDGTTHVVFEPLDFLARLAALVPRPRVNLTRFHGVLAPNARWRGAVTPSGRGRGGRAGGRGAGVGAEGDVTGPAKRQAMTWAQRLKRVFRIEIERCGRCGGQMKVIAAIEDPAVVERILRHVGQLEEGSAELRMEVRASGSPQRSPA
jgi:ribosomal protein S27E